MRARRAKDTSGVRLAEQTLENRPYDADLLAPFSHISRGYSFARGCSCVPRLVRHRPGSETLQRACGCGRLRNVAHLVWPLVPGVTRSWSRSPPHALAREVEIDHTVCRSVDTYRFDARPKIKAGSLPSLHESHDVASP